MPLVAGESRAISVTFCWVYDRWHGRQSSASLRFRLLPFLRNRPVASFLYGLQVHKYHWYYLAYSIARLYTNEEVRVTKLRAKRWMAGNNCNHALLIFLGLRTHYTHIAVGAGSVVRNGRGNGPNITLTISSKLPTRPSLLSRTVFPSHHSHPILQNGLATLVHGAAGAATLFRPPTIIHPSGRAFPRPGSDRRYGRTLVLQQRAA